MKSYLGRVDFNPNLLLKEFEALGFQVAFVDTAPLAVITKNRSRELVYDIFSSAYTFAQAWLLNDKYLTKRYLSVKNIPVVEGAIFSYRNASDAILYADKLKYPVVVKPITSGHGEQVHLNIQTRSELQLCITQMDDFYHSTGMFLVEKHFCGQEYRVFVTRNDFYAVVNRIPAEIVGNGVDSIANLIYQENKRRMNPRTTCLCTIKIDPIVIKYLSKQDLKLSSVVKKNTIVRLRENSNVSTGGNCIDVTEHVHESAVDLGNKLLKIFSIPYLGFDLLCEDIAKPLQTQKYYICECNISPGLSLHMLPAEGRSRNVAGAIVDSVNYYVK